MRFYLGTHQPHFIAQTDVPLFVSRVRLADRKTLPKARGPVAIDSGGFTALSKTGRWPISVEQYAEEVLLYDEEIGIDWAAPMDWMCEPNVLKQTGLTVAEHQFRTVSNFMDLRVKLGHRVIPVLQGWEWQDYLACVDLYLECDVDLLNEPPDSPRYAALGDAVTVNVAEWIGRRILEAEASMTPVLASAGKEGA